MFGKLGLIAAIALAGSPLDVVAEGSDAEALLIADVVAELDENDLSASELRALNSFAAIEVIDLAQFEDDPDREALDRALERTEDGWAMVQTAIVENEDLRLELRGRSIALRNIVAASAGEDGSLTIYTRR